MLYEEPEIGQAELSKRLKISQPAVSARLSKLKKKGTLTYLIGTNVKKAQLFLARIDIATNDVQHVLGLLDKCPLFLNAFLSSGQYNLIVFLVGENVRSLMSCTDAHIRKDPLIRDMKFELIITPDKDFIVPVKPYINKSKTSPCEKACDKCAFYSNDRCLGCPASVYYKGALL